MRNGELYALRWQDVDFETGLISVTKQWTSKDGVHETKSNRNRVVPISQDLRRVLQELKPKGGFRERMSLGVNKMKKDLCGRKDLSKEEREGPLLTDLVLPRHRDWKHGRQSQILGAYCENLGIPKIKFHDLRATFITNMLAAGVALPKVMAIVGHSEMSTTNEYLRLAGVDLKGATAPLPYQLGQTSRENNVVNLFRK